MATSNNKSGFNATFNNNFGIDGGFIDACGRFIGQAANNIGDSKKPLLERVTWGVVMVGGAAIGVAATVAGYKAITK